MPGIAICTRRSDGEAAGMRPLTGSALRPCHLCGAECVVSPSILAESPDLIVCNHCQPAPPAGTPVIVTTAMRRDHQQMQRLYGRRARKWPYTR